MLSFASFAHNVKQPSINYSSHHPSLLLSDIHSTWYHEPDSFFVLVMGKSSRQRKMSLARDTTSTDTCKHKANTTLQIGVCFSKMKCVYSINRNKHPLVGTNNKYHMTVYLFNMPTEVAS